MEVYEAATFFKSRAFSKLSELLENFITWKEQFAARKTDTPDSILTANYY